jgi:methylmalonyl-CoA mutase
VLFDLTGKQNFLLDKLLHSIDWPFCMISFQIDESSVLYFSDSVEKYIARRNFNSSGLRGFVATRTYPHNPQSIHKFVHTLSPLKKFRSVGISVPPGPPVQSIVNTLTRVEELMSSSLESALSVDEIFRGLFISIEIGTDFFIEIARLKALRLLWIHLGFAYGLQVGQIPDLFIHATSAPRKNPTFQPHEHMLTGTLSAMAAIAGGCDALTVIPEAQGDEFQERIARNVSNLLREESHFNKVADATAGSYYVETLANEISQNAWTTFQKQTFNS